MDVRTTGLGSAKLNLLIYTYDALVKWEYVVLWPSGLRVLLFCGSQMLHSSTSRLQEPQ